MASLIGAAKVVNMKEEADKAMRVKASDGSRLESLYLRYAGAVYTLCLRLLASVRAAEEATVAVFVRFNREMKSWLEESQIFARLRELAIEESLSQVNRKQGAQPVSSPSVSPSGGMRSATR